MVLCPECKSKIPAQKLIFLTNFNTIICSQCKTELKGNRKINSIIGATGGSIGGGLGAFLLFRWTSTSQNIYGFMILILFIALVIGGFWAMYTFTKLEVVDKESS